MSQVDEVRAAADIVKVVGDYVRLRKAGANFMGLCPFHQEKTPSFAVHPVKQIFHCFGCGVGGDVFKFVMMIENLSFAEALHRVAEKVGVRIRETGDAATFDAQSRQRTGLYKLHEAAAKYYAAQLGATAEGRAARAYLADRGLNDETVARFHLGYAPAHGQGLTRALNEAGFDPASLDSSGLILSDGARRFDRFRRRIIFPIANESRKVVAFGARALGDEQPKYLNSPETPIYTKSRVLYHLDGAAPSIRKLEYAILVEGYMDAIAVASAGIEHVVATCGTSLTEAQVRLLARYARRVVVNYDPDSAGVAATQRSLDLLLEGGFEVKVLALPGGLDPDSFIRQQGAAAYRQRLADAPTYLDYLTDRAAAQNDLGRPEGKVAAANAVLPFLARVPNAMLRAELATRLAERLRLDDRLLQEELKRVARSRALSGTSAPAPALRTDAPVLQPTEAEKKLLRAFLDAPELAGEFLEKVMAAGLVEGAPSANVFSRLAELGAPSGKIDLSELADALAPEEQRMVYECAMSSGAPSDRKLIEDCCQALRRRQVEREREKLQAAILFAERQGDQARLAELLQAKIRLAKELAGVDER